MTNTPLLRPLAAALSAAGLVCTAPMAWAQTEPRSLPAVTVTAEPDNYSPPDSSTATHTDTPWLEVPQSSQVVPLAVIQDQNGLTLSEAVRNVSGVQADFGFNGALQPLIILRGFPSVSMTAYGSISSTYYLDGTKVQGVPIDMTNVQQVDVVKGPNSVLNGRAEPGGVVNVISKQPSAVPFFSLEQSIGSYGLSRTAAEATGPLNADGSLLGRVPASYLSSDSIRNFVVNRLGSLTGSLSWVPNAGTRINATLSYSDNQYRTDYGVPAIGNRPKDLPWSTQFNDSPDLSYAKTTLFKLDGFHKLDDVWTLNAKLLSVSSRTREVDVSPYRVDLGMGTSAAQSCPGTGNPLCRYYLNARPDGHYQTYQANADLVGKFKTGELSHTVLLGINRYTSKKMGTLYTQQLSSANIDNPVLGSTSRLDTSTAAATEMDDRSDWTSLYLQDQLAFGNGVFLTAGLSYERTKAIYGTVGTAPNEQSFVKPRLGAVWQFASDQAVYAQYQQGVSANNGRDTVTQQALAAEQSRQMEVGHKSAWLGGKLSSTVALYQLIKYNRAGQVAIDAAPYYNWVTVGEARTQGLEWDLSGQLTSQLSLIGSYALTSSKVTRDPTYQGMQLANVARNTGSLWARYAVDSQWSAGGGVFAQGQRQCDLGNTFQLPGYARFDAMLAYRFRWGQSRSTLQLNVDNLFDRKYYTSSHQYSSDWIKLGDPRSLRVTLRVEY